MPARTRILSERGQRVDAGQRIGAVETTGRSNACHLHFELWTVHTWYSGGQAVDPLHALESWDAAST